MDQLLTILGILIMGAAYGLVLFVIATGMSLTGLLYTSGTVVEDIRVPADATDIGQYLMRVTQDADALVGWLSGTQGVTCLLYTSV